MKLRNKKTGEIKEVIISGYPVSGRTEMWDCSVMNENEETGYESLGIYTSLAELNEEWEDYEKTEYYFIDGVGIIRERRIGECEEDEEARKIIGNYFETEEQAEKAVEKLKAWKRLKDKGFKFDMESWENSPLDEIFYEWNEDLYDTKNRKKIEDDMRIVFSEMKNEK